MDTPAPPARAAALAHLIDAFEDALARDPAADPGRFLPPPGHPLRLAVLGELIRIDLECAWSAGRPKRLTEYRDRFPAVFETMGVLSEVAFEEYRQRRLHGEAAAPEEYRAAYGIDTSEWPTVHTSGLERRHPRTPPPGTERVLGRRRACRRPLDPRRGTRPTRPTRSRCRSGCRPRTSCRSREASSSGSAWRRSWAAGRSAGSTSPGRRTSAAGRSP